jgi:hypothetical protein
MLRRILMGAGMVYMARRFMGGGRRGMSPGMSRGGFGFGRRGSGF